MHFGGTRFTRPTLLPTAASELKLLASIGAATGTLTALMLYWKGPDSFWISCLVGALAASVMFQEFRQPACGHWDGGLYCSLVVRGGHGQRAKWEISV